MEHFTIIIKKIHTNICSKFSFPILQGLHVIGLTYNPLISKKFTFTLFMIIIFFIITWGILWKILFFELFIYIYVFLLMLYMLNILVGPYKYLDKILSMSNIIIRLSIPILMYILSGYNKMLVAFTICLFILAIRFCFADKLTINKVIYFFFFYLASNYIHPFMSVLLFEYSILRLTPEPELDPHRMSDALRTVRDIIETSGPNARYHHPHWNLRIRQDRPFDEQQRYLQEMLMYTQHGRNFNELVPADVNDFNIAKANNAVESLQRSLATVDGHVEVSRIGDELAQKITNGELSDSESPIHCKLTYEEVAVLKYFATRINTQTTPGLISSVSLIGMNGLAQHHPFTNETPFNIRASGSIARDSTIGSQILNEIARHRNATRIEVANRRLWD